MAQIELVTEAEKIFEVYAEFYPGVWTLVYSGTNEAEAISQTAYWDETVHAQLVGPPQDGIGSALDWALEQFDTLITELKEA